LVKVLYTILLATNARLNAVRVYEALTLAYRPP